MASRPRMQSSDFFATATAKHSTPIVIIASMNSAGISTDLSGTTHSSAAGPPPHFGPDVYQERLMANLQTVKIFPSIGIARIGNAPTGTWDQRFLFRHRRRCRPTVIIKMRNAAFGGRLRSEERRVGKECRSR